jgi:diadenosine tetraphosphate (Ap4A) HIT family hydrolase/catechol 2,3-dioxygenase-like lactoylglutathione lyase family enzyme
MACALSRGEQDLPGGLIHRTRYWLVEHCVGPLGLGTLIVKPERHVTSVADLSADEAAELGPLLRRASAVAGTLVPAEQVYNCLWSHAGGRPVHVHYVVQPVTKEQMAAEAAHGPNLQVAMFSHGTAPDPAEVDRVCRAARLLFTEGSGSGTACLDLVTIVVERYDPAIEFFVERLGFVLAEDAPSSTGDGRPKRWVVVRPPGGGTGILLAQADGEDQASVVGGQVAGRVGFFVRVEDFDEAFERMTSRGVQFVDEPRTERYGRVAVFLDVAGNRWDLLGPEAVGRTAD